MSPKLSIYNIHSMKKFDNVDLQKKYDKDTEFRNKVIMNEKEYSLLRKKANELRHDQIINQTFLEKFVNADKLAIYFMYGHMQPHPGKSTGNFTLNFLLNFKPEYMFDDAGLMSTSLLCTSTTTRHVQTTSKSSRISSCYYLWPSWRRWCRSHWSSPPSICGPWTTSPSPSRAASSTTATPPSIIASNFAINSKSTCRSSSGLSRRSTVRNFLRSISEMLR